MKVLSSTVIVVCLSRFLGGVLEIIIMELLVYYYYGLLLAPLFINNNNELVANLQAQQCYDNSHFTEWFLPKMKNVTWDLLKYHRIEKEQRCV